MFEDIAEAMLNAGMTPEDVCIRLEDMGLSPLEAETAVEKAGGVLRVLE